LKMEKLENSDAFVVAIWAVGVSRFGLWWGQRLL
jgi:hypothetical protein